MNYKLYACALLLAAGAIAQADALNKHQVTADAKWLVHVDCDNLRQTHVGEFLLNRLLAPQLSGMTGDLKLNVTNMLQRISSLTAYGADFKSAQSTGTLLINSDEDTQKVIEGLLVAQILANTNGPVKKLPGDDPAVYSFGNEIFISPQKGGPIVVSRSEEQIDAVREVLAGKSPSLAATKTFGEFPILSNSFFVLGAAELFSQLEGIPVQAKVLQMADGGSLTLGEKDDEVHLDLALRGKTAEVTKQIRQVAEGMVALVNLGQPGYPDLMDLIKSTKVSSQDRVMTISMHYPADKVIAHLTDVTTPKAHVVKPSHHKAHNKGIKKQETEAEEPADKPAAEEESKESK